MGHTQIELKVRNYAIIPNVDYMTISSAPEEYYQWFFFLQDHTKDLVCVCVKLLG